MSLIKLGILGCGNMGGVILKSILNNKIIGSDNVIIFDVSKEITEKYKKELNIKVANDEVDLFNQCENIIFAIKPQYLTEVLEKIISQIKKDDSFEKIIYSKIFISIAAGIPINLYEKYFSKKAAIIRIMPNILALVNQAASAITRNNNVTQIQFDFINQIFKTIGTTVEINESLMDVVTGLSGSGPAFAAIFIESLADGAVKMGLPRNIAYKLASQVLIGTGEMVNKMDIHPAMVKDMVSSPGGTTIAGIHALEQGNFRSSVISCIEASVKKAKELGNK